MIDLAYFQTICEPFEVEAELVFAIAKVESALDPQTARYEPGWKYWFKVDEFAKSLRITRDTEKVFQATSWGLMQVMGTVARELGFDKHLTELTNPQYNVLIGVRKLQELSNKYDKLEDVISSYNQGYPRKDEDGEYANKHYVNTVLGVYKTLK